MSKLKLNLSEMGAQEILTRKELKQIVGGTDYDICVRCENKKYKY